MGRASITAEHLLASASTSNSLERGHKAEDLCVEHLLARDWVLIAQRLKTPFAEIDILMAEPSLKGRSELWHAVEVKTITSDVFLLDRVKGRQRARLVRAREHLQEKYSRLVALDLMTIDERGEIQYFADFLS